MSDFIGELELKDDEDNVVRFREYKDGLDITVSGKTVTVSLAQAKELGEWLTYQNEED